MSHSKVQSIQAAGPSTVSSFVPLFSAIFLLGRTPRNVIFIGHGKLLACRQERFRLAICCNYRVALFCNHKDHLFATDLLIYYLRFDSYLHSSTSL
jgi:hypothetical protein